MRPMTIEGRRIPCKLCGKHSARLRRGPLYLCKTCNFAFAAGYVVRDREIQAQRRHVENLKKCLELMKE